jgi:hypothetical protein
MLGSWDAGFLKKHRSTLESAVPDVTPDLGTIEMNLVYQPIGDGLGLANRVAQRSDTQHTAT